MNGVFTPEPVSQGIPVYQIITPVANTQAIFNFEYRIPIFGPGHNGAVLRCRREQDRLEKPVAR